MTTRKGPAQTILAISALVTLSAAAGLLGLRPPASYLGVTVALVVAALIYYFDEIPLDRAPFRRR